MRLLARGVGMFFRSILTIFLMVGLLVVIGLAWLDDIAHGRKSNPKDEYYGPLTRFFPVKKLYYFYRTNNLNPKTWK